MTPTDRMQASIPPQVADHPLWGHPHHRAALDPDPPGHGGPSPFPVVVFGLPLLFGQTFLSGDNFLQNFPMRVLVGHDLRQGMLPLWNPYLFGGTPLLAGFNAGAAYPTTWLMAVLPTFVAWWLNLAVAYDLAIVGTYLFLRASRSAPPQPPSGPPRLPSPAT